MNNANKTVGSFSAMTFRKTRSADSGFGDRGCSLRTPGVYGIFVGAAQVGVIDCQTTGRYMASRQWRVWSGSGVPGWGSGSVLVGYADTLAEAKKVARARMVSS